MTRVTYAVPISADAKISADVQLSSWYMTIGKWIIEIQDGYLVVRGLSSDVTLLRVEADQ